MLDYGTRCLTVHEVTIGESILEHRDDGIAIVSRLRANILEHECQRLQAASPHVEFGGAVFRQDRGYTRESCNYTKESVTIHIVIIINLLTSASLRNDGNGNGTTDATLSFLDSEIGQQHR